MELDQLVDGSYGCGLHLHQKPRNSYISYSCHVWKLLFRLIELIKINIYVLSKTVYVLIR